MIESPPPPAAGAGEMRAVSVLALGFGLVGIDRYLISTLFPVIARDLHLNYGDIGTITGALSFAWGTAALLMGNLSDHIGRRRVLTGALIAFALLIGANGLAAGLVGLVAVRVVMGFADGAYTPASISATLEASAPGHHGRNIGIQQMTLTLFGLGLSPLLVAWLLRYIEWRFIFLIFIVPALFLAWRTWRVIGSAAPSGRAHGRNPLADWRAVLGYRNVRILILGMLCWLSSLVITSALMPSYLLDHLHTTFGQMSEVMSAIGFGSMAGTLTLPWLSDRVGRKLVMVLSTVGAALALLSLQSLSGASIAALFASLFAVHFFNNALITLTVGPVCSESVPPALTATASGLVIAGGELFGGGLVPIIGGQIAEHFGIQYILWLPIGAATLGFVLCLSLQETRAGMVRSAEPIR